MLKKLWTTDYNIILAYNYLGKPSSPLPVSYLCTFGVFRSGVASGGAGVVPLPENPLGVGKYADYAPPPVAKS